MTAGELRPGALCPAPPSLRSPTRGEGNCAPALCESASPFGRGARALVPAAASARGADRKSVRGPRGGAGGLVRARVRADVHGKDEEGRRPAWGRAEPDLPRGALGPRPRASALVTAVRRRPPTP